MHLQHCGTNINFKKEIDMKSTKIITDQTNIWLECVQCDMWECLGIDDSSKRLNALPILRWEKEVDSENERSVHECTQCTTTFEVEWDYTNELIN